MYAVFDSGRIESAVREILEAIGEDPEAFRLNTRLMSRIK